MKSTNGTSARDAILNYLRGFVGTGGGVTWQKLLDRSGVSPRDAKPTLGALIDDGLASMFGGCPALYAPTSKAWAETPAARMLVNDGPADEPAVKSVDVDALLRRADLQSGVPHAYGNQEHASLIHDIATALRTELVKRYAEARQGDGWFFACRAAKQHLRSVLAQGWPDGTTGPEVVRKARAFLAGEEQSAAKTCNFCNGALEDQSFQGLADRVDEAQRLRTERDMYRDQFRQKANALGRMVERHEAAVADLASEKKARAVEVAQHRAQLATEDEAHAHTRARLAEVERKHADALGERTLALAAQNRAEGEAASLRAQLNNLETAIRALVERVEKGRA